MGACELPTGTYYVFDYTKDLSDMIIEINDVISENISRLLLKRVKDLKKYINRTELSTLVYDVFSEYSYEYKDDIINTEEGYHTGLIYIDKNNPLYVSDWVIDKIWDYIEDIIGRSVKRSIIEDVVFDALNNSKRKIDKILEEYSIGIISSYCHFGFGYISIIEDPYGELSQLTKWYDE